MLRIFARWPAIVAGLLVLVAPLLAHHPVAAKFDLTKRRTLNGIVTRVDWSNPHVHVLMNCSSGEQADDTGRSNWRASSNWSAASGLATP